MQKTRRAKDPAMLAANPMSAHRGNSESAGRISYHPTQWTLVNRVLNKVDRLSGGRAGWVQRFISYGLIGSYAAVVNLVIFSLIYYGLSAPFGTGSGARSLWYIVVFIISAEISTLTNFVINDHVTFRNLPGHARTWWMRCLRFHLTSLLGTLLTLALSFGLHQTGTAAILAEAIALAIAFLFNFAMHHLFTYRQQHTESAAPLLLPTPDMPEMRELARQLGYAAEDETLPISFRMPRVLVSSRGSSARTNIPSEVAAISLDDNESISQVRQRPETDMLFSIVIPAHNEEENVRRTVENLIMTLTQECIPFEILVINDHSTDRTEAVLQTLSKRYPGMRYVNNMKQGGFGRAIQTGLEHFTGDAVCIVMADASDDPADVVKYYRKLEEGYECAFGSRFMRESKVVDYPRHKLFVNRLANRFIDTIFRLGYNDTTNAFKAYKREVIAGAMPILAQHFNITVELPLKAVTRGYSYAVIPINWYNRTTGVSKLKIQEMGSRYLFIVLYIWLENMLSRGDYLRPQVARVETNTERIEALANYETMPHRAAITGTSAKHTAELAADDTVIRKSVQPVVKGPETYSSDRVIDGQSPTLVVPRVLRGSAAERSAASSITNVSSTAEAVTTAKWRLPQWQVVALLTAVSFIVIVSRRPDALFHAEFWAEDGAVWFQQAYTVGGLHALLLPQAGYFQTYSRLVAWLAVRLPLLYAPLVFNIFGIAAQILPAVLLASPRLNSLFPDWRIRVAVIVLYLAIPNSTEIDATLTNAQWHLALAALLAVLSDAPLTIGGRWQQVTDIGIVLLSGLTGPFCLFLLPLAGFAWWIRGRPSWLLRLWIVDAVASAVQLWALLILTPSSRHFVLGLDAPLLARVLGGQIGLGLTIGDWGYSKVAIHYQWQYGWLPWLVVTALALVWGVALVWGPWQLKCFIAYSCMQLIGALYLGLGTGGLEAAWTGLAQPGEGQRYFMTPMLTLGAAFIWLATQGKWWPPVRRVACLGALTALLCTAVVGIPHDFVYPALPNAHWSQSVAEFERLPRGASMQFQINPPGWSLTLSKH